MLNFVNFQLQILRTFFGDGADRHFILQHYHKKDLIKKILTGVMNANGCRFKEKLYAVMCVFWGEIKKLLD